MLGRTWGMRVLLEEVFGGYCARGGDLVHVTENSHTSRLACTLSLMKRLSLEEIVEGGLCIGCGLCKGVAGTDRIQIVLTPEGRERPVARRRLDEPTLERINAICPGTRVEGAAGAEETAGKTAGARAIHDLVWGPAEHLSIGYAGDADVRHRGATGGVLTALGQFLLASGRAKFILHVAASGKE